MMDDGFRALRLDEMWGISGHLGHMFMQIEIYKIQPETIET